MAKQYEHIFFDLDHTLWDFEKNSEATLRDLYDELDLGTKAGAAFEHFHKTYHHYNDMYWDRFRKGHIKREELRWKRMWRTLVEFRITDEPLAMTMSERYLDILPTKTHLFPHCVDLLEYLRDKGSPMHLITNGFEKTQHEKLKNSGIDVFFKEVITSEQAGIMKPHKEIFDYAMRVTGSPANQSVMIGDALEVDILGALEAGMDAIYVHAEVPAGSKVKPTHVAPHLGVLKELL
jgi:putative hydrolase of the HAD superfamily